ncbi:MAG: TIGR01459 family HAD-type hydrolase [Hyphomonadaceae bacterium]
MTSSPQLLSPGLSIVASAYDGILSDVWGVIHNGREAFGPACEALQRFRRERGPVILITNAPVAKARVTAVFDRVGVPHDCYDDVISSGDATRDVLRKSAPGPVYPIGLPNDTSLYDGLDLELTSDPSRARLICCTSLRNYPDGHPDEYADELRGLRQHGIPMVCANPDVVFRHGDKLIWSAGSLAKAYEEMGGTVIAPGKPGSPIYDLSLRRLNEAAGRNVDRTRILAVGDGPSTDIRGANDHALDALFIGDGIHGGEFGAGVDFLAEASSLLVREGVVSRYVMPSLNW